MRFRPKEKNKVRAQVEMTPLIDVVFQLIIFFMLSSTFVVQTSIPINLPVSDGATKLEQKNLVITLKTGAGGPDNGGEVCVGTGSPKDPKIADWPELINVLTDLKDRDPDAVVLIRPDRDVTTQRLIDVLAKANSAGIERYGIAAQAPQEEEK